MIEEKRQFCNMCKQILPIEYFYRKKNSDGTSGDYLTACKYCLCMYIDDTDPITFLWIIKELNIPYIPEQWKNIAIKNRECRKYSYIKAQASTLGRYISKMKLQAYKNFQWKDTVNWFDLTEEYITIGQMRDQGYSEKDIFLAIKKIRNESYNCIEE